MQIAAGLTSFRASRLYIMIHEDVPAIASAWETAAFPETFHLGEKSGPPTGPRAWRGLRSTGNCCHDTQHHVGTGRMFAFIRKRFVGSYCFLICCSRERLGPKLSSMDF
jgi:hypothetical protein